jgi:hypothetical protein
VAKVNSGQERGQLATNDDYTEMPMKQSRHLNLFAKI